VPLPIARLLHRRIAVHLAAHAALPDSIAPHWAGAGEWQRAGEAYAAAARGPRARRSAATRSSAGASPPTPSTVRARPDAAFDARCESIHSLIVVRGVTHAKRGDRVAAGGGANARAARRGADGQGDRGSDGRRPSRPASPLRSRRPALARAFASPWPGFEAARLHAVGLAQAGRAKERWR
jgi:hypothetical protein